MISFQLHLKYTACIEFIFNGEIFDILRIFCENFFLDFLLNQSRIYLDNHCSIYPDLFSLSESDTLQILYEVISFLVRTASKVVNKGYIPSLQEYLNNAWISSSGPVILLHLYYATMNQATDVDNFLHTYEDLVYNVSLIIRLCNDLGTTAVYILYKFCCLIF